MKNFIISLFLISVISIMACNSKTGNYTSNADSVNTEKENLNNPNLKLKVLYFHATNRCPTCNAVENNAVKLLNDSYKLKLDSGIIFFESYNFDLEKNKSLARKYEVSFSSLLLVKKVGAQEVVVDFSDIAFQYAKTNPEKYAELLKTEIDKQLNN